LYWAHVTENNYWSMSTGAEPSIVAAGATQGYNGIAQALANGSFTAPNSTDEYAYSAVSVGSHEVRGIIVNMRSTNFEPPPPLGVVENKHLTDVEYPPPLGVLRTST